ncbi:acetyl-CoA carboxylase biotin carboxylase subunit [Fluoribacter gormanii]|uniref:Biotin carboxylase n=1 Tax=Fluoribacter gormanii TaxID=464 RepID=A0A377GHT3_9GAMM|nr:acetyl-CoA carboxylase biotin carboxylase subunit [Fluoribacter gormanii]KTD03363.1 acyl CoA carboxylase subunit alpha [Fluoribacter gormanii]MCW8469231.1 acetyl-CoA carboxylase biotin carboxylase subunit [Fluoribacter gormanii]SIQ51879.1 3-methylcrotonyl-CoA carboxylase alpha subunit [Fluoribacter gormanii]STO24390.1 Acetyl-/propionyl-coenzyme A carboxylase alpha chain [Fluoribacter gormanii]
MFNKILIANRGEIACRIIKTARSMGIHTVAIYSSVDKDSLHVRSADSAYFVGEAPAKDSYLNIANIIHVAKECGAQAIHPGYGFLSENPEFAKACNEAGIIFIGPSVEAMEAMASKQLAKQLLERTKVPLTPGYHGSEQAEDKLLAEAKIIGFPVLIKAANGGGGKGMRAVYHESEFSAALAGAKRESMASFADDTMILEKLVLHPRHVELQIMADNHGNVVHLFERDCSIQRRHQKIIEEAPAPNLSASLRQKLAEAACEVARSIKYIGAGTVEFLVDGSEQFYFMEMNTRLQVEHPVTEMITGLDLVAWQLKIAANEPLPLPQDKIQAQGHAIECRIYAEDPHHNFIPSIGQISFLQESSGDGIRIDTGVERSSQITMYYDPMISKLIVWGTDRDEALSRLEHALSQYFIGGVKTNISFLQAICQHPKFRQAELSTDFLSKEEIKLPTPDKEIALLMAVSFDYLHNVSSFKDPLLQETFSWQSQISSHWIWRYKDKDELIEAFITPINKSHVKVQFKTQEHLIHAHLVDNKLRIETKRQNYHATVENKKQSLTLYTSQGQITIERFNWETLDTQTTAHKGQLTAPMPATVVAILKNIGEKVKAGERLIVLEAMKMEHTIHAPTDGILLDIFYAVGAQVNEGEELLSLSEADS